MTFLEINFLWVDWEVITSTHCRRNEDTLAEYVIVIHDKTLLGQEY